MFEKWHTRGNIIDNIQSFSIAWGRKGHKGAVRGPGSSFGGTGLFLSAIYIPLANIKLHGFFLQGFLSSFNGPHFC